MSYVERLEARLRDAEDLMRELIEYHEAREFYDLGKIQMFLRRAWPQPEDEAADNGPAGKECWCGLEWEPNCPAHRTEAESFGRYRDIGRDQSWPGAAVSADAGPSYGEAYPEEAARMVARAREVDRLGKKYEPASAPASRILTVDDEGTLRVYSERDD